MAGETSADRARAHAILRAAGAAAANLERADNALTTSVWATPDMVVKMGAAGSPFLRRERRMLEAVRVAVPALPLPVVVTFGRDRCGDFLLERRLPGAPLLELWPSWPEARRVRCTRQLAGLVSALHNGTRQSGPASTGSAFYRDLRRSIRRLDGAPGLEPAVVDLALALAREGVATADRTAYSVLVHNDLQFNNILADDRGITGLLDFGRARRAPPDLELDLLLRFVRFPRLFAREVDYGRTREGDYAEVVPALRQTLPALFADAESEEGQARQRLYSLAYDFRQLARAPHLLLASTGTPWARILETVRAGSGSA